MYGQNFTVATWMMDMILGEIRVTNVFKNSLSHLGHANAADVKIWYLHRCIFEKINIVY